MFNEKKFIIVKKYNRIQHFVFPASQFHDNFAHDNGFYHNDVLETGLIRNKRIVIVECRVKEHLPRIVNKSLFSDVELRARELDTLYAYSRQEKREVYILPNGD
jgi:hypothetical protein